MTYSYGDLIVTQPEYGGHQYLVLERENDGYKCLRGKKTYTIRAEQILEKIGEADYTPKPYNVKEGSEFALEMGEKDSANLDRWLKLALLKPGDPIDVIHRNVIHTGQFVQINLTKPKFVFSAKIADKTWEFPVTAVYTQEKLG